MFDLRRREFITLLGGAAVAWPVAARAQQTGKVYRIGYLGVTSYAGYAREIEALLSGLRRLGYEEGKNIAIVYQFAAADYDRLPALASELATSKVELCDFNPEFADFVAMRARRAAASVVET